jgi:uncharacterized protein with HEPN domain
MPKREMKLLLQDIVDNAAMIFEFVDNASYEAFINNKMKVYAVVRAFEIIGEASKQISPEIKAAYPLIEWQLMADFRNLLTHHYFGIEYEILWKTIKENLPHNYEMLLQVKI